MEETGWRVVILSNIPEVVEMTATSVQRLGHRTVGAVAAMRRHLDPRMSSITSSSTVGGVKAAVARDSEEIESILLSLKPDLVVSWAFPWRVLPGALEVPRLGAINFHPSALPRHRGSNAVAWTLRSGDSHYGVTWHWMDGEYDRGPILAQRKTPVLDEDTVFDVVPRMSALGLRMLNGVFRRVANHDPGDPQPLEGATRAEPFGEDYATIDWSMPARGVHNQVRAWAFTPGTNSVVGPIGVIAGQRFLVRRTSLSDPGEGAANVECGDGPLWIVEADPVTS
jgi:methionyl-tRNA formyltransferase